MELKDFIAEAIGEIIAGVISARTAIESEHEGARVAPPVVSHINAPDILQIATRPSHGDRAWPIHFDVSVGALAKTEGAGDAKVSLNILGTGFNLGGGGGKSRESTETARLQFTIPVFFPHDKTLKAPNLNCRPRFAEAEDEDR